MSTNSTSEERAAVTRSSSMQAAALTLLGESCEIANKTGLQYVVCGGWSTVLRNTGSILHPGTRDVDLLFSEAVNPEALRGTFEAFRNGGYLHSAKHDFQMLRLLEVGGHKFLFNVDFLHPSAETGPRQMFVDHLELYDIDKVTILAKKKSMMLPRAQEIFDHALFSNETIDFITPAGEQRKVTFGLIDEVGLLFTKSYSCATAKRPRDIFDIYLAIKQPRNPEGLVKKLVEVKDKSRDIFPSLAGIRPALSGDPLSKESFAFFTAAGIDPAKALSEIASFLDSIGVPEPLSPEHV